MKELNELFEDVIIKYGIKDNPQILADRAWVHMSKGDENLLIKSLAMPELKNRAKSFLVY